MESMVETMKAQSPKLKDHTVWCKPDLPVHVRAPISFLFGLKKLLVSWEFNEKAIYVDESSSTMEICKVPILETSSQDGVLKLKWLNQKWQEWGDLHKSELFQELHKKCNTSLLAGFEQRSKGIGKGSLTL